jgi:hypothetical protein
MKREYSSMVARVMKRLVSGTLQMFTGVYRVFAGKSKCRDFRIAGFICMYAFSINSVGVLFMDFAGKL